MRKFIFCLALIIQIPLSGSAWASNRFAVTIFYGGVFSSSIEARLPTVKKALRYFETHGYESLVLSNTTDLGRTQWPLNLSNIRSVFSGLESKVGKDDIVIINVITHGDVKGTDHKIILGNDQYLDVPTLHELIAKLEQKESQIVLLDQSCYAGGSLPLGSTRTCVVAASSESTVSYREFSERLWDEISEGKSIEEVFLATREADRTIAYPAISSAAGKATSDRLAWLHAGSESAWYRNMQANENVKATACIDERALGSLNTLDVPEVNRLRDLTLKHNSICENEGGKKERTLYEIFGAERPAYRAIYKSFPITSESSCRRITF